MTPFEREELKRQAQEKLVALRERGRRLRRRVLTVAAVGFVALWVAIFVQMVTGHDPALGPATATARPAAEEASGEAWSEAARLEAEPTESEAGAESEAAEQEAAEAEAAELEELAAEELAAAITGQS